MIAFWQKPHNATSKLNQNLCDTRIYVVSCEVTIPQVKLPGNEVHTIIN